MALTTAPLSDEPSVKAAISLQDGHIPFFLRIGFVGHRSVSGDPELLVSIRQTLSHLGESVRASSGQDLDIVYVAITAMADGADRLFARQVLEAGGMVEAILPMPEASYEEDFNAESLVEFRELLAKASRTQISGATPHDEAGRAESYRRAAVRIIDSCDVLVAIWDGLPAGGVGGTAESIEYARESRRPMAIIDSNSPLAASLDWPLLHAQHEASWICSENKVRIGQHIRARAQLQADNELVPLGVDLSPEVAQLRAYIAPYLVRADSLAVSAQRRFLIWSRSIYVLSALSSASILAQVLFASADPLWALPELICLIAIGIAVAAVKFRHLHERWIGQRNFAESIRALFYLGALGVRPEFSSLGTADIDNMRFSWTERALYGISLGLPAVGTANVESEAMIHLVLEGWLIKQRDYFRTRAQRLLSRERRITKAIFACFSVTVVLVLDHVLDFKFERGLLAKLVVMLTASLPILGGALSAIRSEQRYEQHAARYWSVADSLDTIIGEISKSSEWSHLRRNLVKAGSLLQTESKEWFGIVKYVDVELAA